MSENWIGSFVDEILRKSSRTPKNSIIRIETSISESFNITVSGRNSVHLGQLTVHLGQLTVHLGHLTVHLGR